MNIDCYHGVNHSPRYYDFAGCGKVLIPFNLVFENKISLDYVLELKQQVDELIIDSGAAAYYLNSDKGYPESYLEDYIDFLLIVEPDFAFALDSCFENKDFQNRWVLDDNFKRQKETIQAAREVKLVTPVYPVVQGWGYFSYAKSAVAVKNLLQEYSLERFGIGSVCRSKKSRVKEVLGWISTILKLDQAHIFGQTQRTAQILKRFGVKSLDSSNAAGNAGRKCYCDPFGNWFYSEKSNQGNVKHHLEKERLFESKKEMYNYYFRLNVESLELACLETIPDDWVHPVKKVEVVPNV